MPRKAKSKFIDPTRAVSRSLRQRLRNSYYDTFMYRRVLKGTHPVQILVIQVGTRQPLGVGAAGLARVHGERTRRDQFRCHPLERA